MGVLTVPRSEGTTNPEAREPRPVRVLVVDDSLFMRKLISGLLEEDAEITVVGQARDGLEGLERIAELDPDVVTLDVEMPRLDGLGALERLMQVDPRPVVMVSGLTRENAEATIASLRLGAVDFLAKPSGSVSPDLPRLKKELQAKVKAAAHLGKGGVRRVMGYCPPPHPRETPPRPFSLAPLPPPSHPEPGGAPAAQLPQAPPATAGREGVGAGAAVDGGPREVGAGAAVGGGPREAGPAIPTDGRSREAGPARRLVVVGASTGGPAALHFLVGRLAGLVARLAPVAMLIVQHIPVGFSATMAQSLSEATRGAFRVEEASPRPLRAGDVLLAPGGYHIRVVEGPAVDLSLDPPVAGVRPAVDVTLMSAARLFRGRLLALILTGMGSDGLRGAMAVRGTGGRVVAQDRATSVVYGMPRAVAEAGLADRVLPLETIPEVVAAWVGGVPV